MDKNVLYGALSLILGVICFLNRIIWKNQVPYMKKKFYLWYAIILSTFFIFGGFYILMLKPYH
jgi:hypothetical protein